MNTGRPTKAFLGPQEQYTSGLRSQDQNVPGNVIFQQLLDTQRCYAKRFLASATYTAALVSLNVRRRGTPNPLTIAIYSDSAGAVGTLLSSINVTSTRLSDILSEWLSEACSQALSGGTYYWIVLAANTADSGTKPLGSCTKERKRDI